MKKLFLALLLATSAMICVAPSQELLASEHSHYNVYGSFYTTETGTNIAEGGTVPLELIAVKSHGVEISGGNILIKHPGDYLITYGVALSGEAEFQLFLNESFIPGTQQAQGPDLYHPFSTIIRVSEKNSILSIVAATAVCLQNRESGDTTAFLTIFKVD